MSNLSKSMFINEAAYQEALAEGCGTTKAQHFLMKAALYFEQRPTKGEDSAHWANVYNAKNCREVAGQYGELLEALKDLTDHYVELINSGDCGAWDVEEEPKVIAARAAIQKAEGR